jgi:hypothetical protein
MQGGKMNDNPNPSNPLKLSMAIRCYQQGVMGHRFSRPLTPAEGERLREIIESNNHGRCIFRDQKTHAPVGAWLCCCEECEIQLLVFAAEAKVSIVAQAQGDKSYTLTSDSSLEIQVQEIGVHDQARLMQTASVASQVAAQIAGETAVKIAQTVSEEVARATTVATMCSASEHAVAEAAEPKLVFHHEKPN